MVWRKTFLIICFFILKNECGFSQFQEVSAGIGGALYFGDLSPDNAFKNNSLIRLSAGASFSHHWNNRLAIKASLIKMLIAGSDDYTNNSGRNLSFQSNIWEFSVNGELYLLKWNPAEGYNFTLYGSIGAAVFYHNPKALYQGKWYSLQPLHTEGQGTPSFPDRKPYSRFQIAIPLIGGIKVKLSDQINVFIEFGPRITFTDYLDDVSKTYPVESELGDFAAKLSYRGNEKTFPPKPFPAGTPRGNPGINDYYFNGLVGISYSLDNLFDGIKNKRVKCPTF